MIKKIAVREALVPGSPALLPLPDGSLPVSDDKAQLIYGSPVNKSKGIPS